MVKRGEADGLACLCTLQLTVRCKILLVGSIYPKPFTGIEEHGRLVEGRSKLLKSDEK